jgi:hypothetical protein
MGTLPLIEMMRQAPDSVDTRARETRWRNTLQAQVTCLAPRQWPPRQLVTQ